MLIAGVTLIINKQSLQLHRFTQRDIKLVRFLTTPTCINLLHRVVVPCTPSRERERERHTQTQTHRETERDRQTETDRHTETGRHRDTHRDRERQTDRDRQRQTDRETVVTMFGCIMVMYTH